MLPYPLPKPRTLSIQSKQPGPILRLPDDILTELFRQLHLALNKAPLVLTRVCSRWRRIAINDPVLWTQAEISKYKIKKAKAILSWSGSVNPLRISINCDGWLSLDWLEPYAPRVQELSFTGSRRLEFPKFNLDQLERLELETRRDGVITFTQPLPSLRYLHMNTLPFICDRWKLFPLSQLTHLVIFPDDILKARYTFPLLLESKHLQHLEFQFPFHSSNCELPLHDTTSRPQPIILPHLRSLKLDIGWETSDFLLPLILPGLERIYIGQYIKGWLDPVRSLAERSSFNLAHFSMRGCLPRGESSNLTENNWDDQIIGLLRCIPSIEYLHSTNSGVLGTRLLQALSTKGDAGLLGPSLRTLSILNFNPNIYPEIPHSELVSAFNSRNQGVDPGVCADTGRDFVVIHHDRNMAEKELDRVKAKENPRLLYARHVVFRS